MKAIYLLAICLSLAACSSMKWPHLPKWGGTNAQSVDNNAEQLEKDRAHARVLYTAEAAVGRPGAFVCRKLTMGIAESDWIRGTVVEAKGGGVKVEISDPGRYPHTLNGTETARGALVWDDDTAWVPCIK